MRHALASVATLSTLLTLPSAQAQAYPIDCAILLCLAGGFPASEPCMRAKAEMIRRITPWPIEPPLQIWNCPLRATYRPMSEGTTSTAVVEVSTETEGDAEEIRPVYRGDDLFSLFAAQSYSSGTGKADIDIGGSDYDFVRSIRVFSVERAEQRWVGGETSVCKQVQRVRLGTYGKQGGFSWKASNVSNLPKQFKGDERWATKTFATETTCQPLSIRSVFIEWRDHTERYEFEQIDY